MLRRRCRQIAGMIAIAGVVLTIPLTAANGAEEGEALFEAQCAACHGPTDIAFWAQQHPQAEDRQVWLDGLLRRHYPPAEQERARIIEYIEHVIASQ